MNAIFAAQKGKIPIDVVRIEDESDAGGSTFLQQASFTTNGVYTVVKPDMLDELPQYLLQLYAADQATRGHLVFPKRYAHQYSRCADMVVGKLIFERNVFVIDGFVRLGMSVEFAYQVPPPLTLEMTDKVFCQRYDRCSTCGTKFDSPGGATALS